MTVVEIQYVDYGAQGEYGFFGKVVARSTEVAEMTEAEREAEKAEMIAIHGGAVTAIEVTEVPAVRGA